jgi:hypothetical protein
MPVFDAKINVAGEDPCDEGDHDWCQANAEGTHCTCVKPGCKSLRLPR